MRIGGVVLDGPGASVVRSPGVLVEARAPFGILAGGVAVSSDLKGVFANGERPRRNGQVREGNLHPDASFRGLAACLP